MASARMIQNIEAAIKSVRKDAATHNSLMVAYAEGRPGWPAYGQVSETEAGGHRGWMERYQDIEGELRPLLVMAHAGHSDREIVAAGYDHERYRIYR